MVIHLSTLLSSLSRFFIPSQSLLIWRFVRRVNLITGTGLVLAPVFQHLVDEVEFCFITLGSSGKVVNLTFNPIAVPAKHPTDESCFMVVV
jgi:hypothetical protein